MKVAYEYKNYDVKLVDLVQEGNIGLMKAVRRFNPERGYRLISYAVWWIKAYMQNYILKNWSMVKIGATAKHRRMLFGRKEGPKEGEEVQEAFLIPAVSSLSGGDFVGTNADMAKRDFSLDAQMGDGGGGSYMEMLAAPPEDITEQMARSEMIEGVQSRLEGLLDGLNERQRFILEHRLIADEPITLQEIGNKYGISRERARQLEAALKKKLARSLRSLTPHSRMRTNPTSSTVRLYGAESVPRLDVTVSSQLSSYVDVRCSRVPLKAGPISTVRVRSQISALYASGQDEKLNSVARPNNLSPDHRCISSRVWSEETPRQS